MFSYIEGKIADKNPACVVIDVNGIGYNIHISLNTYTRIQDKDRCKLLTHFIVRDDAHILYGFSEESERNLFRKLISVSGVGSNTAILILSSMTTEELNEAIVSGNISALKSVKGIGSKTAQRIIVDLKDKLEKEGISIEKLDLVHNTKKDEALSGLTVLGFSKGLAEKALNKIIKEEGVSLPVEELIKKALKVL